MLKEAAVVPIAVEAPTTTLVESPRIVEVLSPPFCEESCRYINQRFVSNGQRILVYGWQIATWLKPVRNC
jgi:hypothetical protein